MKSSSGEFVFYRSSTVGIVIGIFLLLGITAPVMVVQPSLSAAAAFVISLILSIGLLCLSRFRTVCSCGQGKGTLRIVEMRWPFSPKVREIPISSIDKVELRFGAETDVTVLVLKSDEQIFFGGTSRGSSSVWETSAAFFDWIESCIEGES